MYLHRELECSSNTIVLLPYGVTAGLWLSKGWWLPVKCSGEALWWFGSFVGHRGTLVRVPTLQLCVCSCVCVCLLNVTITFSALVLQSKLGPPQRLTYLPILWYRPKALPLMKSSRTEVSQHLSWVNNYPIWGGGWCLILSTKRTYTLRSHSGFGLHPDFYLIISHFWPLLFLHLLDNYQNMCKLFNQVPQQTQIVLSNHSSPHRSGPTVE